MIGRRDLIRLAGLATAGGLAGAAGCARPDESGLRFMYWGSSFEQTSVEKMLNSFERQHRRSVQPLFVPREYETKVNTLVASNRLPDVFYLGPADGYRIGEHGWLVNLAEYLDRYPELGERLPGTYFWLDDEKLLGTQTANEVILLWYNKELFADAGVEMPPARAAEAWAWDTFVQTADRLTLDAEGRRPSQDGFETGRVRQFGAAAGFANWYPLVRSNGGDIVDETGRQYTLNSPECVEVFQNLQDLIYRHRVAPSPAQLGNASNAPTTTVQLQTKRTAMVIDGQWVLLDMAGSDLDFGIGVLPSYQEPATMQTGGATVISSRSRYPEEALELYLFHNDPQYVSLYEDGLWMPLDKRYYTDPELIASWIDNDVHPAEYKTAVVDYALDHAVTDFKQKLKNMLMISEILDPAFQVIANGQESAKTVLDGLADQVEPLLDGWYPSPEL